MTTATAPSKDELQRLAADRWDTVGIGAHGPKAEDGNSPLLSAWMAKTRKILGQMVHGAQNDDEYGLLCDAEERMLRALGNEAFALVITVETSRRRDVRPYDPSPIAPQ